MRREITCLIVKPFLPPKVVVLDNYLEEFQKVVGGNIEMIPASFREDECVILCDEEGKMKQPPELNRSWRDSEDKILDIICGTFLIVAARDENQGYSSLTEEEIKKYEKVYGKPELFYKNTQGEIVNIFV